MAPYDISNLQIQIVDIWSDHLVVRILSANNCKIIGKLIGLNSNIIENDLKEYLFKERNEKKRIRRHEFKLKKNKYDKSKYFHKDKY